MKPKMQIVRGRHIVGRPCKKFHLWIDFGGDMNAYRFDLNPKEILKLKSDIERCLKIEGKDEKTMHTQGLL